MTIEVVFAEFTSKKKNSFLDLPVEHRSYHKSIQNCTTRWGSLETAHCHCCKLENKNLVVVEKWKNVDAILR